MNMRPIRIPKVDFEMKFPIFNKTGNISQARDRNGVTEIDLYDEIGHFGISAKQFKSLIRDAGDIRLRINSPGGDVFDGIAMYNDLIAHKRMNDVNVEITGLAASAASIVAMAGSNIAIAENAFLMIHNAWGMTIGNKQDHEKMMEILDKIDGEIAETMSRRTGLEPGEIQEMMNDETWFNGKEAVDKGFANETIEEEESISALFDLIRFKNTPAELLNSPSGDGNGDGLRGIYSRLSRIAV